jgi:hypothetical protein
VIKRGIPLEFVISLWILTVALHALTYTSLHRLIINDDSESLAKGFGLLRFGLIRPTALRLGHLLLFLFKHYLCAYTGLPQVLEIWCLVFDYSGFYVFWHIAGLNPAINVS